MKDKAFYNAESISYSSKRYPQVATSYVQFFFKLRLELLCTLVEKYTRDKETFSLLEVGCADGIVLRALYKRFGTRMFRMKGIDVAEDMLDAARKLGPKNAVYSFRDDDERDSYDVVTEVGVVNYSDVVTDLLFLEKVMKKKGVVVLSIAGKDSLYARIRGMSDYEQCLSYAEYEAYARERFTLAEKIPCGLYVPYLWRWPALARLVQPWLEKLGKVVPHWCHEQLYVLRSKK